MLKTPIPVAGPSITQKEIDYVTDAVTNAWYEKAGVYNEKFEKSFAEYLGRRYAISLPSCTSGLHLALLSLGIGPGDEVIVPEITWIATAAPIDYVGATPVFADVDPDSWCLSPQSLDACISPRTKAVILVDLYGNMPDMNPLLQIARANNLAVIEDAAEAIGSEYHGRKAGAFGDVSTFSFHGSKTLTTGEGGMLVTDRDDIYERCLFLRDHGRSTDGKMFWNLEVAYKYKMSSLQAALGLAQLERIEDLISFKRQLFAWYQELLADIPYIRLNSQADGVKNTYWMVTLLWDQHYRLDKYQLIQKLRDKGVDSRPFFNPLSSLPAYQQRVKPDISVRNPNAYTIAPYGINLPSSFRTTKNDVVYIRDVLESIFSLVPATL